MFVLYERGLVVEPSGEYSYQTSNKGPNWIHSILQLICIDESSGWSPYGTKCSRFLAVCQKILGSHLCGEFWIRPCSDFGNIDSVIKYLLTTYEVRGGGGGRVPQSSDPTPPRLGLVWGMDREGTLTKWPTPLPSPARSGPVW